MAELRSGLLDATDAHRSAGLPPSQAALAAIRESGDTAQVAVAFGAEIAASQARRVAITLLVTGPGKLSPAPAAAAAAASLARLMLARRAARRCLTLRASLI